MWLQWIQYEIYQHLFANYSIFMLNNEKLGKESINFLTIVFIRWYKIVINVNVFTVLKPLALGLYISFHSAISRKYFFFWGSAIIKRHLMVIITIGLFKWTLNRKQNNANIVGTCAVGMSHISNIFNKTQMAWLLAHFGYSPKVVRQILENEPNEILKKKNSDSASVLITIATYIFFGFLLQE